jgi:serine O-acetyltransferase
VDWLSLFRSDIDANRSPRRLGPRRRSGVYIALSTPQVWALLHYRIAHAYWARPKSASRLFRLVFSAPIAITERFIQVATGVSIDRSTVIGPSCGIAHTGMLVIAGDVRIGHHCHLFHNVTIGHKGGKNEGVPTIGNNVWIFPGAVLAGKITVGDGAVIGANSVVTEDVPERAVVAPARSRVIHSRDLPVEPAIGAPD